MILRDDECMIPRYVGESFERKMSLPAHVEQSNYTVPDPTDLTTLTSLPSCQEGQCCTHAIAGQPVANYVVSIATDSCCQRRHVHIWILKNGSGNVH